ncbi:TPA: hypothetical protein ACK8UX_000672 [Legionella pneumophila]
MNNTAKQNTNKLSAPARELFSDRLPVKFIKISAAAINKKQKAVFAAILPGKAF